MTITYPLTFPSSVTPRSVTIAPKSVVSTSKSKFTMQAEVFAHQGQYWEMTMELPPLAGEEARNFVAFLLSLNGPEGTFVVGDASNTAPLGLAGGLPVVDGAGQQRSKTLNTRGWTPSANALKAGDYIQIGQRLHMVLSDADADASGLATLDVWPRIRDALADGAPVITTAPAGLWRLSSDPTWSVAEALQYGISVTCEEAL